MLDIRYSTVSPDEVARKLAHKVLIDNTKRVQEMLTQDERQGRLTMQMVLDVMHAWTRLVAEVDPS